MRRLAALILALAPAWASAADSVCYGTPGKGRLEHGVQLPGSGRNFVPYSSVGVGLGRTYAHAKVRRSIVDAYAELARTRPATTYMYGESGWAVGGRIQPHRTHQNGLAVDFMVPVLDARGRSVALPTSIANRFGYDIEFDAQARYGELSIDFEAIADHLHAVQVAAAKQGVGISRVIFEPAYLPQLYRTRRGAYLKRHIRFMQGQAWVRHDEHYHIDFLLPCKPLRG
ncbi:penicillin-insensitive murein endopeptidase [Lysobacter sp. Root604]|uniref:penicillin-insensitive murein endopeptidase n=1 Tax=Lysobacter sp. Root604 TaxID=1736568 RepID=UPI0006FAE03F|nr:penicillin-insensitive murein endopeptidase [Lysobacter sp. Root604]KRA21246.1 peptidase [Lysobacter sp. Root604]